MLKENGYNYNKLTNKNINDWGQSNDVHLDENDFDYFVSLLTFLLISLSILFGLVYFYLK